MRVGRVLEVVLGTEFVPNQCGALHSSRMAPSEEMRDVNRTTVQRVLQSKGVDHEHGIVVVELNNDHLVLHHLWVHY